MSGLLLSSGEDDFKRRLSSLVSEPCFCYYDTSGSYVNKFCTPPGYSLRRLVSEVSEVVFANKMGNTSSLFEYFMFYTNREKE